MIGNCYYGVGGLILICYPPYCCYIGCYPYCYIGYYPYYIYYCYIGYPNYTGYPYPICYCYMGGPPIGGE